MCSVFYLFFREKEEEALKEKLRQTQIDVTKDGSVADEQPDAVVNLTFDSEGHLVGAEQEKRIQSGKSCGSTQFAIKSRSATKDLDRNNSASSTKSERQTSAKHKKRESSARSKSRGNSANSTIERRGSLKEAEQKKIGMKPLTKEEQQDMEELQREEEYQRAEQKKIQVQYESMHIFR